MLRLGRQLGESLSGGEVIELVGDIGAGKTTLTKGIAKGLGVADTVQSPTFTISRIYSGRDGLELRHYDFYRLTDAGIMREELAEAIQENNAIIAVEWAGAVEGVLPENRLQIDITPTSQTGRLVKLTPLGGYPSEPLKGLQC